MASQTAHVSSLLEGFAAPPFSLPRDDGGTLSLENFVGEKLVLFLFPRADTAGCTAEAKDFSRLAPAFAAAGAKLVGMSADAPRKLARFRTRYDLAMPLISDAGLDILSAYGAWGEKQMYGRRFEGVLRTTFLIGCDGRIAQVWRNVKVPGHAEAVLAAAEKLP